MLWLRYPYPASLLCPIGDCCHENFSRHSASRSSILREIFGGSYPLYHTRSFRGVEQNTARDTQHRASAKRRDPDRLSICKTPADQYQVGTQHHSSTAEQPQPTLRQLTRRTHNLSLRENFSHTLCTGGTPKRWKSIGQDLSTGDNLSCCFLRLCRADWDMWIIYRAISRMSVNS